MTPFKSMSEVTEWFKALPVKRACSILIDYTSIGVGMQQRTITLSRGAWVIGFPGVCR